MMLKARLVVVVVKTTTGGEASEEGPGQDADEPGDRDENDEED